jgi:hypothetical protein
MMQTPETFSVPRSLQPPVIPLWLSNLAKIELAGTEQLGEPGTILLLRDSHIPLFRAIYALHLSKRQGLFMPSWHEDDRDYIAYLGNKYDALVAIASDTEAEAVTHNTLSLARAADALIFPIGISITPQVALPGQTRTTLPLPGARVSVVIEAPFKTAEHPEQIPSSWHKAVISLLERANAQAQDVLRQSTSSAE